MPELKVKAVIFDMDGVLIDSEEMHDFVHKSFVKRLLADRNGERFCGHVEPGVSVTECYRSLLAANGFAGDMDAALKKLHGQHFKEMTRLLYAGDIALCESVARLLPELYKQGILLAVASSSVNSFVNAVLEHFGVARYFSEVVSGEQVQRKKPAPDIYREAVRRLGVSPQHALAVEDSGSGVTAAYGAGLRCLWYRPGGVNMPPDAYAAIGSIMQILDYIGR